jgi:hypothetical protein
VKRRYTRKELGAKLRELGLPISDSKLNKMCAPAQNLGPPVDVWFGRRPLYDIDAGILWAESLLRSGRSSLENLPSSQNAQAATGG